MKPILCPYCHVPIDPVDLEEAAEEACRYLVCPECDSPLPLVEGAANPGDPEDAA